MKQLCRAGQANPFLGWERFSSVLQRWYRQRCKYFSQTSDGNSSEPSPAQISIKNKFLTYTKYDNAFPDPLQTP